MVGGAEGIRTSDLLGAGTPPARVEEAAASEGQHCRARSGSDPKRMIFSAVRRSIVARSSQNAHEGAPVDLGHPHIIARRPPHGRLDRLVASSVIEIVTMRRPVERPRSAVRMGTLGAS